MKNKSFLNKFNELKPKTDVQIETEKKLVPRLTFMGYVMYTLAIAALTFAIAVPEETDIGPELIMEQAKEKNAAGLSLENDDDLLELSSREVLNYYVVSTIFAAIGTTCFFIVWKKKKKLFLSNQ